MSSWLSKQRKGDLVALADEAGVEGYEGLLKDDLITELEKHLRANAQTLSRKPSFKEFYERTGSPVKKDRASSVAVATTDGEPKTARPRRRMTKVKDEFDSLDDATPDKSLVTRTPRAVQRVAERVPLPASPAEVADAIERQTAIVTSKVGTMWKESGVTNGAESLRERLSSVVSIEVATLAVEAYGLQRLTLPWQYVLDTPAVRSAGLNSYAVHLPNLFKLLESTFWAPTTLWATTSLFIPLFFAYFFNLTLKTKTTHGITSSKAAYRVDPLIFNITKALFTWLVYAQGVRFMGAFSDTTVLAVNAALPGGYQGAMIGAGIGIITSIYDAVLKK